MNSFIIKRQPYTFNSWKGASITKKSNYKTLIIKALQQFNKENKLKGELYGTVYYFHKKDVNIDADNLSKPLWDCLTGILFDDDNQVKLRTAGSFDLTKNDFNILNFSELPAEIIGELLESFDTELHTIYVECGQINYSMFKFNFENNAD
jgi:Holliday junction resolvase RusA-like endonuclease